MTGQQLFDRILLRMGTAPPQTVPFLDALNDVLEAVGIILLDERSNMLKQYGTATYAANASTADLPSGFWGFVERGPYTADASAGVSVLTPLESAMDFENAAAGKPSQYEIQQAGGKDTLKVYPKADAEYTVKFAYNKKPSVAAMTDAIPFNGLFDAAIGDILVRVGNAGGWGTATADWRPVVEEKIKAVLRSRTPRRLAMPNISRLWA